MVNKSQKRGLTMEKISRKSVSKSGGFIPQAVWIIGSCNKDTSPNFCTITSVSYTPGPPESLIVSMQAKRTKENILCTGEFTANLCTVEMVHLVDFVGSVSGQESKKDALSFNCNWGEKIHAPVLDASPYVIECKVFQTHLVGNTITFIAEMVNQQIDIKFGQPNNDSYEAYIAWLNTNDLLDLDPILYAWNYYGIGKKIGRVGDFIPKQ